MTQISEKAISLIKRIKKTNITKKYGEIDIPNEIDVDFSNIENPQDVHAVCKALAESQLHVRSFKLGREAKLADIEYISSLLLLSGRNVGENYASETSRSKQGQKFLLKGLDLSGCNINDEINFITDSVPNIIVSEATEANSADDGYHSYKMLGIVFTDV